jgi:transcriptional regulator with XRE-family HTH domain
MTQQELAAETGMSQARISVLENPNYRKFNVGTLQRVAAAFDVALIVRFMSFGELLDWTVTGSQKTLAPLSFNEEFPDTAIAAVLKPKNNVVSFPSALVADAGSGSDSPQQGASAVSYSTGDDQSKVSKSGARDELNTITSQRSALLQTRMAQ